MDMLAGNWAEILPAAAAIVGIDILLSGDNAVVIALACRGLPDRQRRWGILLGALTAVVMRLLFALVIASLIALPWLRAAGSVLLIWIAINLLMPEGGEGEEIASSSSLLRAMWTIAVADLVMSFDNVLAIVAIAKGNLALIALGLLLSIPLVMLGATLILQLIDRFPVLVWAGAALLGWVAGELLIEDVALKPWLAANLPHSLVPAAAALFVVVAGYAWRRMRGVTGLRV